MTRSEPAGATMRAAVLSRFGFDGLTIQDVPVPTPGPGEVLVRVQAAGLNPIDRGIRSGGSAYARPELPAIVGTDMAGTVVDVGADVSGFHPGDRVYGLTGGVRGLPGSLAEYQVADADLLATVPAELSLRDAAALPLVSLTAWEGLIDGADVQASDRVLVHGGAGGVGHIAVQLAVHAGAQVYATVSARNAEYVRRMGATPIDYTTEAVDDYVRRYTDGEGFDVVFDTVGGDTLVESFRGAKPHGRVASCGAFGEVSLTEASLRVLTIHPVYVLLPMLGGQRRASHGAILRQIADLAHKGSLRPRVDPRTFTLDTLADAYTALADGTATSKIVVDIARHL